MPIFFLRFASARAKLKVATVLHVRMFTNESVAQVLWYQWLISGYPRKEILAKDEEHDFGVEINL